MYKYVRAMSTTLKDIKNFIADASYQVDHHIIKLLLFPRSRDYNHWKQEIFSFIHDVDKVKSTNKWPQQHVILECLACHNDVLDNYRITVEDEYEDLIPIPVTNDDILHAIEDYQLFLAEGLSRNGLVRRADVYNMLDDIVSKYSV